VLIKIFIQNKRDEIITKLTRKKNIRMDKNVTALLSVATPDMINIR
jgi:hypothetical protein